MTTHETESRRKEGATIPDPPVSPELAARQQRAKTTLAVWQKRVKERDKISSGRPGLSLSDGTAEKSRCSPGRGERRRHLKGPQKWEH